MSTSNQVKKKKLNPPNPSGKGGFQDNPQNRSSGYWDSTMSISFQYKRFLKMTPKQLKEFGDLPESKRTVAMDIAYSQILASRKSLNHAKEITDRTEGKAPQSIDLTTGGEVLPGSLSEYGAGTTASLRDAFVSFIKEQTKTNKNVAKKQNK